MGHKGTFVKAPRSLSGGGRCEGSPRPVRSPSPGSGSGPRAAPGCGIRGQIRRRSVLATQMSWIGKWGWGEETDPAIPEGGSARRWALGQSWGPCRDPWAPARGARSSTGRAGGIGGRLHFLHLPVCHGHCSSRSPHTAPACDSTPQCPTPAFWPRVPQRRFAGARTPRGF